MHGQSQLREHPMGEMSWEAGWSQGEVWLGQRQREKEDGVLIPGRRERLEDRQREEQACCNSG